jgi:A/G-specific adenine glycosylase
VLPPKNPFDVFSYPTKRRSDILNTEQFQSAILSFYDQRGRKDLPWQQNKSHYRVWVSEVMLQQTQVTTVIPYYQRFMERFPSLEQLAAASLDEVLSLWTGLGYYSRARNLHRCAQTLVQHHNGQWPNTVAELEQLPGIGRSTAGAIHSLATGQAAAILDGNVKRVLCRYYAIEGWPGKTQVHQRLWQLAEQLTPSSRADDYNQAMMDLGATVCTRRKPQCSECPLASGCIAYRTGQQQEFPHPKPKTSKPERYACFALVQSGQKVLLEKRPSSGIWGGLWSLPQAESRQQLSDLLVPLLGQIEPQQTLQSFRHSFSHYHLHIEPIWFCLKSAPPIMDGTHFKWQDLNHLDRLGLPSPVLKLLQSLLHKTQETS